MKKLFISQPMKGKSDEDILAERQKAIKSAEEKIGEPVEVIDFAKGWQDARGCKIENTCAIEYGIPVVEDYTAD